MLELIDLQKNIKLDLSVFRKFIKLAAKTIDECDGHPFSVAFIDDDRMRQLNNTFRGKDSTTDVLSFPNEPDEFEKMATNDDAEPYSLGDIAISVEQAVRQADENGLDLDLEIRQLILHGVLHLCGYDHETDDGEMNARELELRERLGI